MNDRYFWPTALFVVGIYVMILFRHYDHGVFWVIGGASACLLSISLFVQGMIERKHASETTTERPSREFAMP
jgi:hypothetical protein